MQTIERPITQQEYIYGYEALQSNWKTQDEELLLTGKLAYWTYWISKLAEKTKNAQERTGLFTLKRNGLLLLSKSSYVQIRKYVPVHNKKLCVFHTRQTKGNTHQFLFKKRKVIQECPECQNGQEHYFSLYSVAVLNEIEDTDTRKPLFIMYIPYNQLKDEFPNLDSLENVKKYYGTELCTIDIDKKVYNPKKLSFGIELLVQNFSQTYNDLLDYLKK